MHTYTYVSIYICISTATAHYFGKFFGDAHTAGKWKLMFDKGREGQTMHPISPENEDNPKSVCHLAPWQSTTYMAYIVYYTTSVSFAQLVNKTQNKTKRENRWHAMHISQILTGNTQKLLAYH